MMKEREEINMNNEMKDLHGSKLKKNIHIRL